ncbi:MAG: hypothetical protein OEW52_12380, partial [Thermoleophilia bacterium]|nr:hypothetical protein [Thermoleophilia bacterium]
MLTILEGSTFCICDELGDIAADTSGFFAHDTRFLSRLALRIEDASPLLLSSGRVEHFQAAFYLRNAPNGLPRDALSIARERFVGTGLREQIIVRNESMERLEFTLALEIAADFADIISVKQHDFALGDPVHAAALPDAAPATYDTEQRRLSIVDPAGDLSTRVVFSHSGRLDDEAVAFDVALEPNEQWDLRVDVLPSLDGEAEIAPPENIDGERETA